MVPGFDDSIVSAPEVEPPKTAKENIYDNPEVFKDFDDQAIEVCLESFYWSTNKLSMHILSAILCSQKIQFCCL